MKKLFFKSLKQNFAIKTSYLHTPASMDKNINVTLLPGIYIGPEITQCIQNVFNVAKIPISLNVIENFDFSNETHRKGLKVNKYILMGNTGRDGLSQHAEHLEFYKYLNLYARVVHIYNMPNVPTRH